MLRLLKAIREAEEPESALLVLLLFVQGYYTEAIAAKR